MIQGAYSIRFKSAEKQHVEHIKQIHEGERVDMLERSRRLQQETNRRRKALAVKRKLDAQKEEKRRQEILSRRREQMQEATERYQRLNRTHPHQTDQGSSAHHAARATPGLDDALRAVRGSSAHLVRQHSYDGVNTRASSAGSAGSRNVPVYSGRENVPIDPLNRAYTNTYSPPSGDRNMDAAAAAATRLELQNCSLRNLTNSRTRFEQQLEQQQAMLADHQKASLRQFGAAIWRELEAEHETHVPVSVQRTESVSSVDSLEDDTRAHYGSDSNLFQSSQNLATNASRSDSDLLRASREPHSAAASSKANMASASASAVDATNGAQTMPPPTAGAAPSTSSAAVTQTSNTSPSSFVLHRSMSSPSNVAVVQPSIQRPSNNDNNQFFVHKPLTEKPPVMYNHRARYPNHAHELRLEDAHEWVNDKLGTVPCTFPKAFDPSPPSYPAKPSHPEPVVNYVTTLGTNFNTSSGAKPVFQNVDPNVKAGGGDAYQGRLKAWGAPAIATAITSQAGSTASSSKPSLKASTVTSGTAPIHTSPAFTGMYHTHDYRMPAKSFSETDLNNAVSHHNGPSSCKQEEEEQDVNAQSEDSLDGEEEEEKDQEPKSILKRRPLYGPATPNSLRNLGLGVRGQNTSSINARKASFTCMTPVRDSLEYNRGQMQSRSETQITQKKSVRFADLTYDDSTVDGELTHQQQSELARSFNTQQLQELQQQQQQQQQQSSPPQKKVAGAEKQAIPHKPPRPASAKVTSSTAKVDPSVRESRISSAGAQRRGTYSRNKLHVRKLSPRQTNGSPASPRNNKNDSGNTSVTRPSNTSGHPTMSSRIPTATAPNQYNVNNPVNGQKHNGDRKPYIQGDPVYDSKGMRLDRTPTDDEINWLWDKVRTCLSRNSTVGSTTDNQSDVNSTSSVARQVAPVASKCIDGGNLNPQFRTAQRISPNYPTNNAAPKKKITMDNLNNYTIRNNTRQNAPAATTYGTAGGTHGNGNNQVNNNTVAAGSGYLAGTSTGYTHDTSAGYPAASHQTGYPVTHNNTVVTNGSGPDNRPVSESMAAFLTAEALARRSVSDSQIAHAMDTAQHQQHNYNMFQPKQKVPTALSIEEQRLLQSLERLNERLKMTETAITTSNYVPRPPPHRPGFRGHQPITGQPRRNSATVNGTVNRRNFRTFSAGSVRGATSRF